MKILLVCMKYDYGDYARGYSYEYYNFYCSLKMLGHEVTLFDFMTEIKRLGKISLNNKLLKIAKSLRPDFAMFSLYTDQIDPDTVQQIASYSRTLCFFHDDNWRVKFSEFWAGYFDFFTTTDLNGEKKYATKGLNNAIHFPFGCNEKLYRKIKIPKKYDVSFVGAWHPYREWLIKRLRMEGFNVKVAGYKWPEGIVTHQQMVKIFNESRVNLNLSNSASWNISYLTSSPRALINSIRSPKLSEQLKARHFEINGCGGFQLSYYLEGLEKYYKVGSEIAIYIDPEDLVRKIKLYLADEFLRETIAEAGYKRTILNHTFKDRFHYVFERMDLLNA